MPSSKKDSVNIKARQQKKAPFNFWRPIFSRNFQISRDNSEKQIKLSIPLMVQNQWIQRLTILLSVARIWRKYLKLLKNLKQTNW